jgi:hypothetical protein
MTKPQEEGKKFVVEYKEDGKVVSKWHYDYSKSKFGPILVEEFDLPTKPRKSKSKPKKL